MRELKFRAWHIESETMLEISEINIKNKLVGYLFPFCPKCSGGNPEFCTFCWRCGAVLIKEYSFDIVELMQYTGLKDCEGKEIYERDILEFGKNGEKTIVENMRQIIFTEIDTVIGNIYENPELLEEK